MNADTVQLEEAAASLHEQRDYLTQLDAAIGDADHGTNMDRGFTGVVEKLGEVAGPVPPGRLLTTAGGTLVSTVGGERSAVGHGPAAGRPRSATRTSSSDELAAALDAALDGVVELGAAQEGEKTMVDAFAPAVRTCGNVVGGASLADAIQSAFEASEDGMRATVPLRATKGRASYLGERSIGHQDPGATRRRSSSAPSHAPSRRSNERAELRLAASGGVAIGRALVWRDDTSASTGSGDPLAALDAVAADLARTADRFRSTGREDEAEILETNRLMVEDPTLRLEVERLATELDPAEALRQATAIHAEALAKLPDPMLAARATDVRQLGSRAVRASREPSCPGRPSRSSSARPWAGGRRRPSPRRRPGPRHRAGRGSAPSHAAIMARAFGVPMTVGLGEDVLSIEDGDGDRRRRRWRGCARPEREALSAERVIRRHRTLRQERIAARGLPAVTRDGRSVTLLCNASTAAEVTAGLEAGAEGVGLLRTELAFLAASAWPTEDEHVATLAPALARLHGLIATVRTLDFGDDKTPPFLAGITRPWLP